MDVSYLLTPLLAWLAAGCTKFAVNSVKAQRLAFALIGYGGLPSNHTTIVCSMAFLIAFKEGIAHPAFGVAVALAFIVVLDANSLRRQVGRHAVRLNRLASDAGLKDTDLRERMGHTKLEIAAGVLMGALVAVVVNMVF